MSLYLIGLGLRDPKDITLKGLEAIKHCKKVFLETYTSTLDCSVEELEKLYQKQIILADRELIEQRAEEELIIPAKTEEIALLIVGDPLAATTHTDIRLRAKEHEVKVHTIHNASVLTAIGITGLELYKFGKTTSIPFFYENITTPIEVLKNNQKIGLHTLFLLDLNPKVNEYLSIKEAIDYLTDKGISPETKGIGCSGLGNEKSEINYGTLEKLRLYPFQRYPQCLIIPGNLHFIEEEALNLWSNLE